MNVRLAPRLVGSRRGWPAPVPRSAPGPPFRAGATRSTRSGRNNGSGWPPAGRPPSSLRSTSHTRHRTRPMPRCRRTSRPRPRARPPPPRRRRGRRTARPTAAQHLGARLGGAVGAGATVRAGTGGAVPPGVTGGEGRDDGDGAVFTTAPPGVPTMISRGDGATRVGHAGRHRRRGTKEQQRQHRRRQHTDGGHHEVPSRSLGIRTRRRAFRAARNGRRAGGDRRRRRSVPGSGCGPLGCDGRCGGRVLHGRERLSTSTCSQRWRVSWCRFPCGPLKARRVPSRAPRSGDDPLAGWRPWTTGAEGVIG